MVKKNKPVSMATSVPSNKINSTEDHMDLGPFLQEYVLRNPFNPLVEPPPRAPSRDSNHDNTFNPETEAASEVMGGHIGSNVGYAHQLKQLRLPRRHAKVRQWLLQHYKYASFYSGWVSSDALLKEVKVPFSDMKSSVLSRIMKFTYPECRKVINRYGYFYMGLIKRPSAVDFKKENLVKAAMEVNKNTNNVSSVSVKHKLDSFQLASVYVWMDDGPLPENGASGRRGRRAVNTVSTDKEESEWQPDDEDIDENEDNVNKPLPRLRSLRKRTRNAVLGYLRAKLKPVGNDDDTSDDNEPEDKKIKNGKDDEDTWNVKKETVDRESAALTSAEEGEMESPIKIGEVITVKQEPCDDHFTFKTMTDSEDSTTGFSGHNTSDECEAIDMSKKRLMQETNSNADEADNTDKNNSIAESVKIETTHHVGSIPNSDAHSTGHHNSDSNSSRNSAYHRNNASPKVNLDSLVGRLRASLSKDPEPQVIVPKAAHVVNSVNKVGDVNAIADALKCRQELEIVRKDLAIREEENYQLQQDLRSSRQELQEIKEKLVLQDSLLSDLSREFYDLSNHFMKVSHHFKTVVTEVQRTTERLT